MRKYKQWTMQIDDGAEIQLYDGENFKNFERLKEFCKCRQFEFEGKLVYDDNELYINLNDDVMDGITESNPAGEWNADRTVWFWGTYVMEQYIVFRYYI